MVLDTGKIGIIESALQNFNSAFQCYQQGCINNCSTGGQCTYANVVKPQYDLLMAAINGVLDSTDSLEKNLTNCDASMNVVQTQYQQLLSLRKDLDEKMKNLSDVGQGPKGDNLTYFDQTIYTNLLLTVLVVFLAGGVFMKIKD